MKRTIIFLIVLGLFGFGFTLMSGDVRPVRNGNDDNINIIKLHFPQPQCLTGNWYGKVKDVITGQIVATCGPTTSCTCGPEVAAGTYDVWGEQGIDCRVTNIKQIDFQGGILDVYLTYQTPECY